MVTEAVYYDWIFLIALLLVGVGALAVGLCVVGLRWITRIWGRNE